MNLSEPEINTAINQARILTEWAYAEMSKEQPPSELTQNRMVYIDKLLSSLMPGVLAQAEKLIEENITLSDGVLSYEREYKVIVAQKEELLKKLEELAISRNYYIDYNETLRMLVTDVVKLLTPTKNQSDVSRNRVRKALTTLTACLDSHD